MSEVTYQFDGKRIVVTGASSGMGRQSVLELAAAGAQVLAIARKEEALKALQAEYPEQISYAGCDVREQDKLEKVIADYVAVHGKVHGSIHSAGIAGLTPVKAYDPVLAQNIMDTSFWAGIYLVQLCSKAKLSMEGASHIWIASVAAHESPKGMFAYAAAKAGMQAAMKSIAKEIAGRKQRINTISPGRVKTSMTEQESEVIDADAIIQSHLLGEGKPEDLSGMILFLLSDRAKWITGIDLIVDGGYLA